MGRRENYLKQLAEYIKKNLKKGYTKESLRWALVNQGHSRIEVEKALKKADEDLAHDAPVLEMKPEITYQVIEPPNAIVEKKPRWKRWFGL